MPTAADLIAVMESIAPLGAAEPWDNVGLLLGDPAAPLGRVMLTIDYTRGVAEETEREKCDAVIAYHPPLFKPIKHLVAGDLLFDAARRGVAVYSPHTALDVAEGGTNDVLADFLGLTDRVALRPTPGRSDLFKFVTYVPHDAADRVAAALFAAGAGHIGNYDSCGFTTVGTGTFRGGPDTNPAVGTPGVLERTPEVKLETIVPAARVAEVVAALRQHHPYEEPAFDLAPLAAMPSAAGMGRFGLLPTGSTRQAMIDTIGRSVGVSALLVAGPVEGSARTAAVCAGSCGDLLDFALAKGCDVFVTGEMRHHDALRAAAAGMTVVSTLHSNSERVTLPRLRDRLAAALPAATFLVSRADRDPFEIRRPSAG